LLANQGDDRLKHHRECPGVSWEKHDRAGWSEQGLAKARESMVDRKTSAVMIVQGGRVVDQWGEIDRKWEVRSIRKSLLSALYGIHVDEGRIDLGKTLEELGIDDTPPSLTPIEKQATVLDLLRARSGVYHMAARETVAMRAARPPRGSHPPGTFYYYNNWDFNVLGKIFEQLTGKDIFQEFFDRIAKPIGMQDFVPGDGRWGGAIGSTVAGDSKYLHYIFSMTARDMARFGHLFLREGRWGDRQVVPANWVKRSTTSYSDFEGPQAVSATQTGYGFMWWTHAWGYSALGNGGHVIAVIPSRDLVVVHRVHYDPPREDVVPYVDTMAMVRVLIEAAQPPLNPP
jgi:CubicO group peptidase (beta-lactamase class C family)